MHNGQKATYEDENVINIIESGIAYIEIRKFRNEYE